MRLPAIIKSMTSTVRDKAVSRPLYQATYPSFSPYDAAALADLASNMPPSCRLLEIGSWLGQGSTKVLIEAAQKKNGLVYCVDTWRGNPNVEKHQVIVKEFDVLGTFLHNVHLAKGSDIVRTLVMPSSDAAQILADGSFDMVFIDADHSYRSTTEDVQAWLPKVRKGGMLCGHDCEGRVNDFGRERLRASFDRDTLEGNDRFKEIHPGVILAVDELLGVKAQLWAEREIRLSDGARGRSTIWWTVVDG